MELNIGTISTEECSQTIATIEDLKVNLTKTKDIMNDKAYKIVYYSLCKLQEGLNNLVEENDDTSIINSNKQNDEQTEDNTIDVE